MNHAKFSASGSHRWLNCAGSINAENALAIGNTNSSYAAEGTTAHALAEHCLLKSHDPQKLIGQKFEGLPVDAEMAESVQLYIDYLRALSGHHYYEVRVDFSNWVPDGFGTSDAIVLNTKNKIIHVVDLKYGKGVEVYADNNSQGMLYALGALNEYGDFCDFEKVIITIVQPRRDHISEWETTVDELLKFGEQARDAANKALKPDAKRTPGEKQCQWCAAKAICPALQQYTAETLLTHFDDISDNHLTPVDTLTDAQLRQALESKSLIVGWLDAVEKHVTDKLNNGEQFDGFKLVEGRSLRKWKDEKQAEKVLLEYYDEQDVYKKTFISPAQAEKLMGKNKAAILSDLIVKPNGKPTLAPESDKRKSIGIKPDDFDCI